MSQRTFVSNDILLEAPHHSLGLHHLASGISFDHLEATVPVSLFHRALRNCLEQLLIFKIKSFFFSLHYISPFDRFLATFVITPPGKVVASPLLQGE